MTYYVGDSGAELKSSVSPHKPFDVRFLMAKYAPVASVAETVMARFAEPIASSAAPYDILMRSLFQAGSDCIEVHVHGPLPAACIQGLRICPIFAEKMARDGDRSKDLLVQLAEQEESSGKRLPLPAGLEELVAYEALRTQARSRRLEMSANGTSLL